MNSKYGVNGNEVATVPMHHDKKGKAETILHAFQTSAADGDE
jgi:hypothetical protein